MATPNLLLKRDCPFCGYTYATFQNGRRHVLNAHGKLVQSRSQDAQNRRKCVFTYNAQNAAKYPGASIKYCCMSCVATFDTKNDYANHVDIEHVIR